MFPFRNLVNIIPLNKKMYIKVLDKILNIKEQSSFIPYNKNMNYKIKLKQKKYLFLDIDGVLNSFDDYNTTGNEFIKNLKNISFVTSKKQMSILNKIVEEYNPTIILSSYWRTRYSLEELNNIFRENNFVGKISGITSKKGEEHKDRWNQIKQYIDENKVNDFIILDDNEITRTDKKINNFIKTNSYEGLTEKHLKEIQKIW